MAEQQPSGSTEPPLPASRRRSVSAGNLLVLAVTVAGTLWALWWLHDRFTHVYVLDARISADMILLSSEVSGWIVEVPVAESDRVRRGDVLLRIDDRTAAARRAELAAALAALDADIVTAAARVALTAQRSVSHLDAARSRLEAARSLLAAAAGDLEVAAADWQRAGPLRERNLLSQQQFEEIRNVFRHAEQVERQRTAEVATARADLAEAEADAAEVAVREAELAALRQRRIMAEHQLAQAEAALAHHTIHAPADGVIDALFVDPGEHVAASQRVLLMHDPAQVHVKANVKETDVRHLEPGQSLTLRVDAYPDRTRGGTVRRIGDATTGQFALLPNPNPSGNFTKITQRLEVTIDLDEVDPLLKPGMMVEVKFARRS
ncbi:MAG: efflux RND transporter periplasmic adaptor subunit [Pseudomonadales bacterium]